MPRTSQSGRVVAVGLVLGAAVSTQFGSAVAALLFPRVGAAGAVTLRLTCAAVILLVVFRPRLSGRTRADWGAVAALGLALAVMNTAFYHAIARLPIGVAVTFEVLGPLTLFVVTGRRRSSLLWALLALAGVAVLGGGDFSDLDPVGVLLALVAAAAWATYILTSAEVGRRFARADGLSLAMVVAALLTLPLGVAAAGGELLVPTVLGVGALVAVLSSALPYSLEMAALRRIPAGVFAVMMSLSPAIATLAGFVVLGQRLTVAELAGIALVVVATAGAMLGSRPPGPAAPLPRPAPDTPT